MPAPKNEITISPMIELAEAWSRWRLEIPEDERERVAAIVAEANLESKPGIISLSHKILVEVFKGTLSPVVLQAAKPWIELIVFMIDSQNQSAGSHGTAMDTMAYLSELRNSVRPMNPVYVVHQLPEVAPDVVENAPEEVMKIQGK